MSRHNGEALAVGIADIIDFAPFGVGQYMLGNSQIDSIDLDSLFFVF